MRVIVSKSFWRIRQPWHFVCRDARNGQVTTTSENYRDKNKCANEAERYAAAFGTVVEYA